MKFVWKDYNSEYAALIDSWLDEHAVAMTGLDQGWDEYRNAVVEDGKNYPGSRDLCKVVYNNGVPFAVVAYGYYKGVVTVSEVITDPMQRGKGLGSQAIAELIKYSETLVGDKIDRYTAVIYPNNAASQRAFEKAGFSFERVHDDGDALYYSYQM